MFKFFDTKTNCLSKSLIEITRKDLTFAHAQKTTTTKTMFKKMENFPHAQHFNLKF